MILQYNNSFCCIHNLLLVSAVEQRRVCFPDTPHTFNTKFRHGENSANASVLKPESVC